MVRRTRLPKKSASHRRDRMQKIKSAVSEELLSKAEKAVVPDEPTFHEQLMAEEKGDFGEPLKADFDDDVKKDMDADHEHLSLGKVLDSIKADVDKEWKALPAQKEKLGEFLHEVVHLDEDAADAISKNVEVAQRLVAQHPDENILLKVITHEEVGDGAGVRGLVRAEDLISFEDVEIITPDGDVYVTPRVNVREIVGVSPQPAPISIPKTALSYGGLGADGTSVDGGLNEEVEAESEGG